MNQTTAAERFDVVVVGAGAAGLLAAARSAERGRRTLLLEKNRKPGVKILMSGGTRCNLTHDCDEQGIREGFGSAGKFLHSPLAALGPRDVIALFEAEGVPIKVESNGKVFPQSDRALDVLAALLRRLSRSSAELALAEPATNIQRSEAGFRIATPARRIDCERLIVTTGGKSYAGCGTTGDGYRWLAELGHTIRRPRPALVPLVCEEAWVRQLSGVTIPDVRLAVVHRAEAATPRKTPRRGRPSGALIERRGSLLFTHFGLSGPVAMDVSREVTRFEVPAHVMLRADFLPDFQPDVLAGEIRDAAARNGRKQALGFVPDAVPRRLAEAVFSLAAIPADRRGAELSKMEAERFAKLLKQMEIGVSGTRGFDKAEVTAGGVSLTEIDSRTMQSKLVPNLYLAGEILDLDGFIGGYNFQAAFSTGWLAGSSV